jgi:hypothetical protein
MSAQGLAPFDEIAARTSIADPQRQIASSRLPLGGV